MKHRYCCTNPDCRDENDQEFFMILDQESIMDNRNMAEMFCPKCKSKLTPCQEDARAAS